MAVGFRAAEIKEIGAKSQPLGRSHGCDSAYFPIFSSLKLHRSTLRVPKCEIVLLLKSLSHAECRRRRANGLVKHVTTWEFLSPAGEKGGSAVARPGSNAGRIRSSTGVAYRADRPAARCATTSQPALHRIA